MPTFKLPLSGDVSQTINPFSGWFSPSGGQYGLVNINLGVSSEPKVEADVLSDVATYGKQLGRIGDALIVLIDHLPREALTPSEAEAIDELKVMLKEIQKIKLGHNRPAFGPKKIESTPSL